MNCCSECFTAKNLKGFVRDRGTKGACDFCGASEVSALPAATIYPQFEGVLAQVEPLEAGKHYFPEGGEEAIAYGDMLPALIASTWGPFLSDRLPRDRQCDLLDAVRSPAMAKDDPVSSAPSRETWTMRRTDLFKDWERDLWERFCDVIKHKRRYVMDSRVLPEEEQPSRWLPECLAASRLCIERGAIVYRARINPANKWTPLIEDEMGAPDEAKTRNGRISPRGIRVFYGALDQRTAIAETRPEQASLVSVLRFSPKRRLIATDLTRIPSLRSPFGLASDIVAFDLRKRGFVECLDRAFAEPVRREDAEIDYVPTQYIAELIKFYGYNAVVYGSSLKKKGRSIAVFDPDDLHPRGNVALYEVLSVGIVARRKVTPQRLRGAVSTGKTASTKSASRRCPRRT